MPRAHRLPAIPFACYYYRRKSARDRSLIRDREERAGFLDALASAMRKSGARLYAVHVDSTQLHLVARAGSTPLVPALGIFCHELTRRLNHVRGERGALFTERARVTVFQPDVWTLPICRYVHSLRPPPDSPLYANSDSAYRERRRMAGLTTTVVMRALASRAVLSSALDRGYQTYFGTSAGFEETYMIEHGSREDNRILGDREFIATVRGADGGGYSLPAHEDPGERIRRAAEHVILRFHTLCREFLSGREAQEWLRRTTLPELRSKSRRMPLPLVRGMVADHVLARGIATRSEVEGYFHLHPRSLAAGIRRRYRATALTRFSRSSEIGSGSVPDVEGGA